MHIALYSTTLPELGRKPGGVDVHVMRLAERLAGRGHRLDLYTFSPPQGPTSYRHIQLEPSRLRHGKVARLTLVPLLLNRLRPRAEVLHLHGDDWFYLGRTLPTVRTFYGSALMEARTAERLLRRLRTGLIFGLEILSSRLATAAYDIAPGTGRPFGTIGTLSPAVDLRPADRPRATRPTILFVGTWSGRKRGRLLAEVFTREVQPNVPDARLVMVSDHADPASGVVHIPRPTDVQLATLMAEAWIMCLPSSYEGFGIPYAEAIAAGTPVVATPNVGARYVLDEGRAGVITSEERLGETLVRLLGDSNWREQLACRGRDRAAEFAWEQVLDLHEHAYEHARRVWESKRRAKSGVPEKATRTGMLHK